MINGIYRSAAGLDGLAKVQETLAHNLANVSTTGFKQEVVRLEATADGRQTSAASLDLSPGPLQMTGGPTQLALPGPGYFAVQTPDGTAYTRNGDFRLDAEGRLVTAEGFCVLGEHGEIDLGAREFTVSPRGEITVAGQVVDRLLLVSGTDALRPAGNGFLAASDGAPLEPLAEGRGEVMQGALERSNVNALAAMVDMLAAVRLYEANQKALESQDETLNQAVNQLGRTA